jgi:hypothetical protein
VSGAITDAHRTLLPEVRREASAIDQAAPAGRSIAKTGNVGAAALTRRPRFPSAPDDPRPVSHQNIITGTTAALGATGPTLMSRQV